MVLSCFLYQQKFSFNQFSQRKTANGKTQSLFMTFNVGSVIGSGINPLSQSLIPINDKQNQFGMSKCEQMFKTASK